jgi:hypothetical protein
MLTKVKSVFRKDGQPQNNAVKPAGWSRPVQR